MKEPSTASRSGCPLLVLAVLFLLGSTPGLAQQESEKRQQEEGEDHFKKWLEEIAVYIITAEEKGVFEKLTTDEEKEQFIEQFWYRRDPDPRTSANEFKIEHYRRIAYANENYTAGWPGWMTDRGKIYIIHGPPDELIDNPSGGHYERELHEGGGRTSVYPFQKWRYRYIEGLGSNVELEFVDRDFSGVYNLALSPEEKDAFLHVPNAGFTLAEELGMATRLQRPYFAPHATYPMMNYREQDSAFARYETYVNVQRPLEIKNQDLKEMVDLKISYTQVPFEAHLDRFRLNDERLLVPVTLDIPNRHLTFVVRNGIHRARVIIYGMVTDLSNRLVAEFEDEVTASFSAAQYQQGLQLGSSYNRVLVLDSGNRYKIQLVIKDMESGNLGTHVQSVFAPPVSAGRLAASSLVVSGYIAPATDHQRDDQMFVLGDVLVRPSVKKQFSARDYFAVYLQLYNVGVDQSTQEPSFHIRYRILKEGRPVVEAEDEVGESVQYFSPRRMVLIKRLPLTDLGEGPHRVEVLFTDRIRGESVSAVESLVIASRD